MQVILLCHNNDYVTSSEKVAITFLTILVSAIQQMFSQLRRLSNVE